MFPLSSPRPVHASAKGIKSSLRKYRLTELTNSARQVVIEGLAESLEETGWFESELQAAFGELERDEKVKNLETTGKRRTKFVHFTENQNKGEHLIKVMS